MSKFKIVLIFLSIFTCVSFISIGYSSLNTNLSISGEVSVIPGELVRVSSVVLHTANDAYETNNMTYYDNVINFHPFFSNATSTLTYSVTITNYSGRDFILKDIDEILIDNIRISFRLDDFTYGTKISANSSVTFDLTLSCLGINQSGNLSIEFLFELFDFAPDIMQVLDGVKSSTEAYVKTGFFPSSESRIVLDFTFLGPRTDSVWLFSSRRAYQNQMFGIAWNYSESLLQFNNISYNLGSGGYRKDLRYTADISKDGLILNGTNYSDPPDTPWQGIFEFYIFANNEARTVRGHTNGQAIIHTLQIYESGVLVLDAIPVVLEDGEVVFWNNVTDQPLTNVGELIPIYQ